MSTNRESGNAGRSIVPRSVKREVDDKLAFHLAMRAHDLTARGHAGDAEQIAASEFGDLARVRDECRTIAGRRDHQQRRTRFLGELARDVYFALRLLRRRRAFATIAVLTIALGIGAATGIFSVVDGVLLRALPFTEPGRLVAIWITQPRLATDPVLARYARSTVLGSEDYFALRDYNTSFRDVAVWQRGSAMLVEQTGTSEVRTVDISASLLPTLGERPVLGRGFLPTESALNGPKVALVGYETWQARFAGDSAVLGRRVMLDTTSYEIVGVVPKGLRLDRSKEPPAFWLPALQSDYDQPSHHNRSFMAVGRLKPNVSMEAAQREAGRLMRGGASDSSLGARVEDWQHDQTSDARLPLLIMLASSGLLLLIACVNVAMLTLGEAAAREREFASRIALGASAGRVIRQLLAESLTIALAGALLGTGLAWALIHTLVALAPSQLPGIDTVGIDLRALAFAIACATCAGVVFGLTPAFSLLSSGNGTSIRIGAGQSSRTARRTQRGLVAAEIALSLVLLLGASLLTRSLFTLSTVDPGFKPANVVAVRLRMSQTFPSDDALRVAFYTAMNARLGELYGPAAVSAGEYVPFSGTASSAPTQVESRVYDAFHPPPSTEQRGVFPGYFDILGIPLHAGRSFTPADAMGMELVAILSEAAARRDFPGESAIGKQVKYQGKWRRIVGVVGDVRPSHLERDGTPAIYVPLAQYPMRGVAFIIRTTHPPAVLRPAITNVLRGITGDVTLQSVDAFPSLVSRSYAEQRYRTIIVGVFALLAALLATVGLYGVTVRAVARRTREVGIRVALGATPGMVTRLMMNDTLAGALMGVVVGLPLALLLVRRISADLFGVTPQDPVAVIGALMLLSCVAVVSSALPARRAGKANPAAVLAGE
ncbi:MAG: permease [Gemmatimonadetes bacterium]|nr:permease [Gemmatimonadota bacterium]